MTDTILSGNTGIMNSGQPYYWGGHPAYGSTGAPQSGILGVNNTVNNSTNLNGPVSTQVVDPNALVGHQLQGLLATNSDYIQMARAQAAQQAASRGMLNSSMAAGAGQNAAISAALPIAQGNAQEYAQV